MIHQSLVFAATKNTAPTNTAPTNTAPTNTATQHQSVPTPTPDEPSAIVFAGLADRNANLFRRIGLPLGDPSAWIELPSGETIRIVRDLEMDRVRDIADQRASEPQTNKDPQSPYRIACPRDFPPASGQIDSDRETAVAQALAACLVEHGIQRIRGDRSLPLIYAWHVGKAGIAVDYDDQLGVLDRRAKSESEIEALSHAQHVTEQVMFEVCHRIATASVDEDGHLVQDDGLMTSERVINFAMRAFMERGFTMSHGAIVAGPPHSGDCHHAGAGPLKTGTPIIVDLFPRDELSRYHGDCTRTVVHGRASDEVIRMHAAVIEAKSAAEAELFPGRTAESVHQAAEQNLLSAGFEIHRGQITDAPSIQHGTGHGIGLEIHEPILLDHGGAEMLDGEVFTVEPGLYGKSDGGVRVEDMLVVTQHGPKNLNKLPQGLNWE